MSYEQECDSWSEKEHEDLGWVPSSFTLDGELCACIKIDEKYSLMSYDEKDDVWNVKVENIPDMLFNRYCFMV